MKLPKRGLVAKVYERLLSAEWYVDLSDLGPREKINRAIHMLRDKYGLRVVAKSEAMYGERSDYKLERVK